jgi:hypothetical protein
MRRLHAQLISDYVRRNPGTRRRGFERSVRALARRCSHFGLGLGGTKAEAIANAFPLGFLPDAFRVDRKEKALTLVEAEVTSRITGAKWQRISDLYWNLREDDWDVWVHTVGPNGVVVSIDVPLVALVLQNDEMEPKALAANPPGRIIWTPQDGERPVADYYWYDAIQRRMGQWTDKGQPAPAPDGKNGPWAAPWLAPFARVIAEHATETRRLSGQHSPVFPSGGVASVTLGGAA